MNASSSRKTASVKPRATAAALHGSGRGFDPRMGRIIIAATALVITAGAGVLGFRLAGESGLEAGMPAISWQDAVETREAASRAQLPAVPSPAGPERDRQEEKGWATSSLEDAVRRLNSAVSPEAKRAAADALIAMNTEEALSAWGRALLAEQDPAKRSAMMEALDNLNGELAVEMVTQLIELSDAPEVFEGVARALSRMATAETPKYLAEIASRAAAGDSSRDRALRMLGAVENSAAVPGLIHVAHQPALGADLTGQAFLSLGRIGDGAALTALAAAFDSLDPENFVQRQQAIAAIQSVTNPRSRPMLEDLAANSQQPLVATAAAEALKHLSPSDGADAEGAVVDIPAPGELVAKAAPAHQVEGSGF